MKTVHYLAGLGQCLLLGVNSVEGIVFNIDLTAPGLRGCLGFGSEGEHDELWDGFVADFEVRSPATGRESGDEDAQRSRAQPSIENLNSL